MSDTRISYFELTKRMGDIFMLNKVPEIDPEMVYEGLENGTLDYCIEHGDEHRDKCINEDCDFENYEVFQWFLIKPIDAEYLKDHTNELVFYSDVLDEYVWGVTHWGTPWDSVYLEFDDKKIED